MKNSPRSVKNLPRQRSNGLIRKNFTTVDECYGALRKDGYAIYATALEHDSVNLYDLDYTKKIAIVVGNEHRGVSEEGIEKADGSLYIPMFGMVQSLNVSVATAVVLYEILRQRRIQGLYDTTSLSPENYETILNGYLKK